jgi:GlcNAc-P-P-Und epimerase
MNSYETGKIAPFNDYGCTKYKDEQVYKACQSEVPIERIIAMSAPLLFLGAKPRQCVQSVALDLVR